MKTPMMNIQPSDEPLVREAVDFMFRIHEASGQVAAILQANNITAAALPGTNLNRILKEQKRAWRRFPARIRAEAWKRFELAITPKTETETGETKLIIEVKR